MLSEVEFDRRLVDVQCALGSIKQSMSRIDVLVDSCNVLLYPKQPVEPEQGEKQKC